MRTTFCGRIVTLAAVPASLFLFAGCEGTRSADLAQDQRLATYLDLVMPDRIALQYFTRPVSQKGDGRADAIEVVLAAYDRDGDHTKVVGSFHFELETRRIADRIGTQIALWDVQIETGETLAVFRDPYSRLYQFELHLTGAPLPPSRYILRTWFARPDGRRLLDELEFTYDGTAVPPARPL